MFKNKRKNHRKVGNQELYSLFEKLEGDEGVQIQLQSYSVNAGSDE